MVNEIERGAYTKRLSQAREPAIRDGLPPENPLGEPQGLSVAENGSFSDLNNMIQRSFE